MEWRGSPLSHIIFSCLIIMTPFSTLMIFVEMTSDFRDGRLMSEMVIWQKMTALFAEEFKLCPGSLFLSPQVLNSREIYSCLQKHISGEKWSSNTIWKVYLTHWTRTSHFVQNVQSISFTKFQSFCISDFQCFKILEYSCLRVSA